jgi:hypothetical protein
MQIQQLEHIGAYFLSALALTLGYPGSRNA